MASAWMCGGVRWDGVISCSFCSWIAPSFHQSGMLWVDLGRDAPQNYSAQDPAKTCSVLARQVEDTGLISHLFEWQAGDSVLGFRGAAGNLSGKLKRARQGGYYGQGGY